MEVPPRCGGTGGNLPVAPWLAHATRGAGGMVRGADERAANAATAHGCWSAAHYSIYKHPCVGGRPVERRADTR